MNATNDGSNDTIGKDYVSRINELLRQNNGLISATDARSRQILTIYLSRLYKAGRLQKFAPGLYANADVPFDNLYIFQYRYTKIIYSYETALYLLNQTDILPHEISITVENGYRLNQAEPNIHINYVKKNLLELGVMETSTMFGNTVRLYCYERVLCDCITHKNKIGSELYGKVIRGYAAYSNKDLPLLWHIARSMKITAHVRNIMEIIYE
ncbi:type IV toxin-antitoxin system AbiEi family antitoxin domain-containing protein [Alloscardovia omnicolens]|uniref:type IV toxin-antitoxin system AbiEi family antitoxin domain-containing protein n=1 Tax=Alloscardovia omnicolens TaxID=419015 RepID=UPI003C703679